MLIYNSMSRSGHYNTIEAAESWRGDQKEKRRNQQRESSPPPNITTTDSIAITTLSSIFSSIINSCIHVGSDHLPALADQRVAQELLQAMALNGFYDLAPHHQPDQVLDKALMLWLDNDKNMHLHTVLHVWSQIMAELKSSDQNLLRQAVLRFWAELTLEPDTSDYQVNGCV